MVDVDVRSPGRIPWPNPGCCAGDRRGVALELGTMWAIGGSSVMSGNGVEFLSQLLRITEGVLVLGGLSHLVNLVTHQRET